nr:hypothetical protein [Tanacetum cinerariifolium]
MSLTFADTHNMVAYLAKSDAIEGFDQIIDFLNGSYIKYAITVNPHIYESCIKQFWNTVVVKQSNDITRLQALVDKKKVVITEATIRDVLCVDDAEGVDCLPNEEIFAKLARMGYEKPSTKLTLYKAFFLSQWKFLIHTILQSLSAKRKSWNEFSSAMAYAYLQEALDAYATLARHVKHLEHDKVAQALEIIKLKRWGRMTDVLMVDKEDEKKTDESTGAGDDQVKGRQANIYKIDMDHASKFLKVVTAASITIAAAGATNSCCYINCCPRIMMEEPKPMKKKQQVKMDEEYARKLHEELNKDIDWDVAIDHIKQKVKEDPYVQRYQNRAIQSINKTPAQKAAKRRKLNKEVEDLKQHLEIVPDEDDDVYTEATLLVRMVPVVDYEIIQFNNKPDYKIIRTDGTHQLYVSFITLLKTLIKKT